MTPVVQFWLLIALLALGTWLMRSLPIMLHGHVPNPPWAERLLRYVPVAALTALVVPGVIYNHVGSAYVLSLIRAVAGVAALLVALRWKNTIVTLAVGMGVLWVLQWGLAALHLG
jgi:branched-subunit amino acid transport protein